MKQRRKWALEKADLEKKYGCPVDDDGNPIKVQQKKAKPAGKAGKPEAKKTKKGVKKNGK